ncbi:H-type small acid-soluble spore protein [Massilibacterium senegalense]|uniref:H-type small acid-soluble spore protein n=1 Tax=Massilibacterium senegalense TaxID=1632858 RepID=UPI000780CCCE|nr:H-type small acid-soluble spore protein [Massilibacterium senegalense]
MNVLRAKEISQSATIVDVTYNGTLIMIQDINEATEMARVYNRTNREQEMTVPVAQLMEQ